MYGIVISFVIFLKKIVLKQFSAIPTDRRFLMQISGISFAKAFNNIKKSFKSFELLDFW